jgi:hypothetical protein
MAEIFRGRFRCRARVTDTGPCSSRRSSDSSNMLDNILSKIAELGGVLERRRARSRAADATEPLQSRAEANRREHDELRSYNEYLRKFYGGKP